MGFGFSIDQFRSGDESSYEQAIFRIGLRVALDSSSLEDPITFCPSYIQDRLRESGSSSCDASRAAYGQFHPLDAADIIAEASGFEVMDITLAASSGPGGQVWRDHIRPNIELREPPEEPAVELPSKIWPDDNRWSGFANYIERHGSRCQKIAVERVERGYALGYQRRGQKPLRRYVPRLQMLAIGRAQARYGERDSND